MEEKRIQEAVGHMTLPTISHEPEEYILTPEEEKSAIEYAIILHAKKLKDIDFDDALKKSISYYDDNRVKQLLAVCNSNKHQEIWHQQQAKKRQEQEDERIRMLVEKCDANYFYNLIRINADKPLLKNSMEYLRIICFFFSSDNRFETELGFDLNKGLWIRGKTGVGKTFPLQLLQKNELLPFKIHSMLTIAAEVSEEGVYEIPEPLKVIDDVGSEENIVNHFGTRINWFKDFIELYYAKQQPFNKLIITTNLDFDRIEASYGFRVRSRIKDMFNIIDVKGEDLRGDKKL